MILKASLIMRNSLRRKGRVMRLLLFVIGISIALSLFQREKIYPSVRSQTLSNITYDHRSFIINGKRELLIVGAIHYPRSSPGMWPHLFKKSKEAGINAIDTYVFWNLHEPIEGQYDFETGIGNKNNYRICEFTTISKTCPRPWIVCDPEDWAICVRRMEFGWYTLLAIKKAR